MNGIEVLLAGHSIPFMYFLAGLVMGFCLRELVDYLDKKIKRP